MQLVDATVAAGHMSLADATALKFSVVRTADAGARWGHYAALKALWDAGAWEQMAAWAQRQA